MSLFRGYLIVVAALATGVLAGCSPSAPTTSDAHPAPTLVSTAPPTVASSATAARAEAASCSLAPAALVTSTLGVQVSDPIQGPTPDGGVVCTYIKSGSTSVTGANTVVVRLSIGITADGFTTTRNKADQLVPTKDFPGLGDQAYSSTLGTFNTLTARKGTAQIQVSTALATLDQERALTEILFPKM